MSCIISNPHLWTIWSSKGFGIHPHTAEKRPTLLVYRTFGHPVEPAADMEFGRVLRRLRGPQAHFEAHMTLGLFIKEAVAASFGLGGH